MLSAGDRGRGTSGGSRRAGGGSSRGGAPPFRVPGLVDRFDWPGDSAFRRSSVEDEFIVAGSLNSSKITSSMPAAGLDEGRAMMVSDPFLDVPGRPKNRFGFWRRWRRRPERTFPDGGTTAL